MSEEKGYYTLDEVMIHLVQKSIKRSTTPIRNTLRDTANRVRTAPRSLRGHGKAFWQVNTRGWSDESVWNLDTSFTQRLGGQLVRLAATSHGYPGTEEYPEPEPWFTDLNKYGSALYCYHYFSDEDGPVADKTRKEAKAALHWAADHLEHLWD